MYHAVTIGNNEGMTFPHEDLNHLYDDRQFDVLYQIYMMRMENDPNWVKAKRIYETKNGMKIAVTGVTAQYASSISTIRLESR